MSDSLTIDRRDYKRVVPMKVLVCGIFVPEPCECVFEMTSGPSGKVGSPRLARTNILAMRAALKSPGYFDIYYMDSCMWNPWDCDLWAEAFDAKLNGKGRLYRREDCNKL